jgi:hypothetical protein
MMWEREMCLLQHLSHMQSERGRYFIRSANSGPGQARPQPLARAYFSPATASCDRICGQAASPSAMAATNKCLARSNKSCAVGEATKIQITLASN